MPQRKREAREIPIEFDGSSEEQKGSEDLSPTIIEAAANEDVDAVGEPAVRGDVDDSDELTDEPPSLSDDAASPADLQQQVEALTREKAALYDQLLRRAAEFENFRRRLDRERSDAYQRARVEVLLEFLPVVDNFERALSSLEQSSDDADALRHGVELIHKQFKDALKKFGLEPVEAVGQTFDPHVHEAVTIEPTDQHEENTIIEEFQRGYKIGDKLLRPAKVKVASTPK